MNGELIALSVPEVRRLLCLLLWGHPPNPHQVLAWSFWRRKHQAKAKRAHHKRHGHYVQL